LNLLGRDTELVWLADRLRDVVANGAGTVIIGGEAGIGKTSLLDAFSDLNPGLDHVAIGRFRPHDIAPFAGFRSVLSSILGREAALAIDADLLGTLQNATTTEAAAAHRFRAFASLADTLLESVGDEPALMV
jgi:hypothetical protein